MTVRRVMGIETEYGISVPGDPTANPMLLSGYVVNAYASSRGSRAGRASWDYEDEMPLRDARGFEIPRQLADAKTLVRRGRWLPATARRFLTRSSWAAGRRFT